MSRVTRAIRRQLVLLALPLAVLMFATPALAQPTDEELKEARTQFHRALELEQAGNWAGGLRLFREVGEIKMTPQVRFHIALCEENLGKLVAALGGYELALADADVVGGTFKEEVQENIDQLRGRIPKLVIERGEGAEAAKIELDGIELGSSSIGVEVPVDPGPHQVDASAKGYEDFTEAISVEETAVSTLVVEMKRVPKEKAATSAGGPVDSGAAKKELKPLPIALVAGGGVAMAAGGVLLLLAQIQFSDIQSQCTGDEPCEKSLEGPYNQAKTKQAVGFTVLGVGAVSAGAGVYLLLRPEKSESKKSKDKDKSRRPNAKSKASLRLLPAAPGSDAGFSLVGRF
jgi:hypothetical protein